VSSPGSSNALCISTPGRICLFGEHQDYLGLPVIPSAISLRVSIEGDLRNDREIILHLPDIGSEERFSLDGALAYRAERDYLRSALNIIRREGYTFSRGMECTVRGTIPINSGTSSSSALIVGWINFLARMSDQRRTLTARELAVLAHRAEVVEFGEPGGMMDHYSTAYGGILAIDFEPAVRVETLPARLGTFVLGDSHEPKDTKGILARVKQGILNIARKLLQRDRAFSLHTVSPTDVDSPSYPLSLEERTLLAGTVQNRELTREARLLLSASSVDHRQLGILLSRHQDVLRDVLKISTPKIDRMLDAAVKAGAYGGKINGSGGGGCMFVYAPDNPDAVAEAIEREDGTAYVVYSDEGTRIEPAGGVG
jgi:galactokinase